MKTALKPNLADGAAKLVTGRGRLSLLVSFVENNANQKVDSKNNV